MRKPDFQIKVDEGDTADEASIHYWAKQRQRALNGTIVVKGDECPWERGKMGQIKFYLSPYAYPDTAVQTWVVFEERQHTHSGKHIHQGGVVLYALEGSGYTVMDGKRYDWEEGDLIILPIQAGGVEHQQFNTDLDKPCRLLAFLYQPHFMELGNFYTLLGKPGEDKLQKQAK